MRRRRRGGNVLNGLLDRPAHRLTDQIEAAHQLDPGRGVAQFLRAQDDLEGVRRIGQADEGDISGRGNPVAQEHVEDPQLDLPLFPVVDHRIAAAAEHPQEAPILYPEDSPLDEAREDCRAPAQVQVTPWKIVR